MLRILTKPSRSLLISFFIGLTPCLWGSALKVSSVSEAMDAIAKAEPGDTIILKNGRYEDTRLIFEAKGAPDKPITLKAEDAGKVIFTGESSALIIGQHLIFDGFLFTDGYLHPDTFMDNPGEGKKLFEEMGPDFVMNKNEYKTIGRVIEIGNPSSEGEEATSYCRVTNCAIIGYNSPNVSNVCHWVRVNGDHNRVDHCYFSQHNTKGVTLVVYLDGEPDYHRIDHNYFKDRAPGKWNNGYECIRIGTSKTSKSSSATTVEYNLFENCDGEIEIISNKSCDNIYRFNTFKECGGQLSLRHGEHCLVYNNYFLANFKKDSSGVRLMDRDHVVINNYFEKIAANKYFGFRSALGLMDGMIDPPLNRYFKVINATVAFNTFVDCKQNMAVGIEKKKANVAPIDPFIGYNLFYTDKEPAITIGSEPKNATFRQNVAIGDGVTPEEGSLLEAISSRDFWMNGFQRPAPEDIPEELSALIEKLGLKLPTIGFNSQGEGPLTASDVGPEWMK